MVGLSHFTPTSPFTWNLGSPATFLAFFSIHLPGSPVSTRRLSQLKSENNSGRKTCNTNCTCELLLKLQLHKSLFLQLFYLPSKEQRDSTATHILRKSISVPPLDWEGFILPVPLSDFKLT